MNNYVNLNRSIMLHMAASTIETLVTLVEDELAEIDPLEININGVSTGQITTRKLAEEVRKIAATFEPISIKTTVQDNRIVDDGKDGS